jgi:hypothetical protein
MGRPKKSVPVHVEPEDASQDIPDEEPASVIEPTPGMSKADACRAALAAGIVDAEKAQAFTLSKFGVEIKATDFALYKSKQKKAGPAPVTKGKPGRKPKAVAPATVDGYLAPPVKPKAAGEPDVLLALEGVKELMATYGADKVRRIVDLLS